MQIGAQQVKNIKAEYQACEIWLRADIGQPLYYAVATVIMSTRSKRTGAATQIGPMDVAPAGDAPAVQPQASGGQNRKSPVRRRRCFASGERSLS
jgi:hypothetical protein